MPGKGTISSAEIIWKSAGYDRLNNGGGTEVTKEYEGSRSQEGQRPRSFLQYGRYERYERPYVAF